MINWGGWLYPGCWMVHRCIATAASGGGHAAPSQAAVQNLIIFMLIGSLLWGYLSGLFFDISNVVGWERWEGTIEYTFMAPISRTTHILGMCLFSILYGVLR